MARKNNKKNERKENARNQSSINRARNEIEIQQSIGNDYLNPYQGPRAPDTVDTIINNHINSTGPDFDNMRLDTDSTINDRVWSDAMSQRSNLSIKDFGIEDNIDFIMSDNEELNKMFYNMLSEGESFEGINSRINKGLREHVITEDEFNMAKNMLHQNEANIKNMSARTAERAVANEATEQTARQIVSEGAEDVGNHHLKQALSGRNLNALLNLGFAITDYNSARESGESVGKAGAKAAGLFVAGEMLGPWMMPVMAMKALPSLAVSAVETTQSVTRKMNSTTRIQTFGEAQFQDTQQLSTMRQAGMEMAKMSQYNLQQSIMGNEAQYMHRL